MRFFIIFILLSFTILACSSNYIENEFDNNTNQNVKIFIFKNIEHSDLVKYNSKGKRILPALDTLYTLIIKDDTIITRHRELEEIKKLDNAELEELDNITHQIDSYGIYLGNNFYNNSVMVEINGRLKLISEDCDTIFLMDRFPIYGKLLKFAYNHSPIKIEVHHEKYIKYYNSLKK